MSTFKHLLPSTVNQPLLCVNGIFSLLTLKARSIVKRKGQSCGVEYRIGVTVLQMKSRAGGSEEMIMLSIF